MYTYTSFDFIKILLSRRKMKNDYYCYILKTMTKILRQLLMNVKHINQLVL